MSGSLSLMDACMAQIHGGLWAWPCFYSKGHEGPHTWQVTGDACVCHPKSAPRREAPND